MLRWILLFILLGVLFLRLRPPCEVVFFDVGQGDAALVRFPRATLLVDAGGGFGDGDQGRRTLVRELARLGVISPDLLVLSHSDRDHAFGAFGLLETMPLREILLHEGERAPDKKLVPPLRALAALRQVPVVFLSARQRLAYGGGDLDLSPVSTGETRNGTQLGLDVVVEGCRFVLLGDMTEAAENSWLRNHPGRADVLKVSHHGSRTSSAEALLVALAPRWAVVSVGSDNRYGHPAPDVVERYRRRRIEVLRTDFHGAVRFHVANGRIECESAAGSCGSHRCVTSAPAPPP